MWERGGDVLPTFVENSVPHLGTREAYAAQKEQDLDGVLE